MNHAIEGIIIIVAITSMLIVGATMFPIMQNSFASKKHDVKKEHDINSNTNSADSTSSSTATADNTNNIKNTATASNSQEQSACAVAVTCPEGTTTVTITPPPPPPTTGTLIVSKVCDPSCPGTTFSIQITDANNPQPSSFSLKSGQTQVVTLSPGNHGIFEFLPDGFGTPDFTADCGGDPISAGQILHCVITNHPTT